MNKQERPPEGGGPGATAWAAPDGGCEQIGSRRIGMSEEPSFVDRCGIVILRDECLTGAAVDVLAGLEPHGVRAGGRTPFPAKRAR